MYLTIRRYKGVDIEGLRELAEKRADEEGVLRLASEFPGFVAYFLVDTEDGGLMAVSVYLGQAEADVSTSTAIDWVRENMADLVPTAPEVMGGEVLRQAIRVPAASAD